MKKLFQCVLVLLVVAAFPIALLVFPPPVRVSHAQAPSYTTGSITAQATTCQPGTANAACVILQLNPSVAQASITVNGTFSATLQFEGSPDGGSTWVSVSSTPNGGGASVTSTTATGVWQTNNVNGFSFLRVRCSAYTSGVASVTLNPSLAGGVAPGATGTVNQGTANQIAMFAATGNVVSGDANLTDASNALTYTGSSGIAASAGPLVSGANGGSSGQLSLKGGTSGACNLGTNTGGTTDTFSCSIAATSNNITVAYNINGHLADSATAPTISSGFGTSASISDNNGSASFTINVGTGGTATNGVIGFSTAPNNWIVHCDDVTTQSATVFVVKQIAASTTTATIANFNTSGAQAAWVASDSLKCQARAD